MNIENKIPNEDFLITGLDNEAVIKNRNEFGENKLKEKKKTPLIIRILKQLKDPMIILLLIASLISLIIAIVEVTYFHETDKVEIAVLFVEPIVIWLIIAINTTFGLIQEGKVEREISALQKLTNPNAKVIRNGELITIKSEEIVVGDLLFLEAGDSINADGTLLESSNLECDESVLTGESIFVKKDADLIDESKPIIQQQNKVFSGCSVINGSAKVLVTNIGSETQIGKISELINNEADKLTPFQLQLHKLSKYIGIFAIIIAFINFFLYIIVATQPDVFNISSNPIIIGESIKVSISLAIASVPEGMLAVIMVILASSVRRMNKKKALIKRLPAVETLGSVSIICTDKTGTLTQNKMTITKMWQPSFNDVLNENYHDNVQLLTYAGLCSNGDLSIENNEIKYVGDPTETCIIKALYDINISKKQIFVDYPRVKELPFDSKRKLMTVVVKDNNKYLVITKGAPDQVFNICKTDKNVLENASKINTLMGSKALRVLGVAYKYIESFDENIDEFSFYESEMNFVGLLGIIDPPRLEVKDSINECQKAGIRTIMITGDHKNTALAIAKDLNILLPNTTALSGDELSQMSDEELINNIESYSVFARVSPSDKIRIVKAWQAKDKIVSMTGDGVNDAPSLKAADIGCAMGITGTDVSKQAADVILVDDNFSTITSAVKEGRKLMINVKNVMVLLLTTCMSCLFTIFIGTLLFGTGIFNSLQILWTNVLSETIPGIALGLNYIKDDVMSFKPRDKNANIIDKKSLIKIIILVSFISIMSLIMCYVGIGFGMQGVNNPDINAHAFNITYIFNNSEKWAENTQYKTIILNGSALAFVTLSVSLSFNAICLWDNKSLFSSFRSAKEFVNGFKEYKTVLLAFFISYITVAIVVYIPYLNTIFHMNPYANSLTWPNILPYCCVLSLILIHEIFKLVNNKITIKEYEKIKENKI